MALSQYIADRIRELRQGFGGEGLSQEVLGKHLGVAPNTISRWETGAYKPAVEDLDKIARFFGVSVLEFFPKDQPAGSQAMTGLLRAASELPDTDVVELQRYAEFKRAQLLLRKETKANKGRKRKGD